MKNSKFLKLNAFDLVKGLVVAVITAVLTADIGYMLNNLSGRIIHVRKQK